MEVSQNNRALMVALLGLFITLIGTNNRAHAANNAFSVRAFNLQHATQTHQPAISRDSTHESKVYLAADQMPQLKGPLQELYQKVKYPKKCRKAGVQGRVYVQFIVSKKGLPTHVHVLKGIGNGCDDAAIAAVKKYARFTPGINNGKTVRVQMTLPIRFELQKKVYKKVDTMPKLKMSYFEFEKKVPYLKSCQKSGVSGRVTLGFVVNKKGIPEHIRVLRGINGGCNQAAVLAMKKYGRFTPGILNGKPVNVRMTYSVAFNDYFGPIRFRHSIDKMPMLKIMSFNSLMRKVKYPAKCKAAGIEGTVKVGFTVNKKGMPANIHIVSGIGDGCDDAAIQAIKQYARFKPAVLNGKPVKIKMTYSIVFNKRFSRLKFQNIVDKMPKLKMSSVDLRRKVKNFSNCNTVGIMDSVVVGFTLNRKGVPANIHIVKGIGDGCDAAALQTIRKYARFTPVILNGKPVKVKMTYSIVFQGQFAQIRSKNDVDKVAKLKINYDNLMRKINYPAQCMALGKEGKVVVGFIVNKKGMPVNIHIINGIGSNCGLGVIKTIKNYARYTPAMLNGKPVAVKKRITVSFRLETRRVRTFKKAINH